MLELRLQSGQVIAFDGRVLEIFPTAGPSARLHVQHVRVTEQEESAVRLDPGGVVLRFDRAERPKRDRLLAALSASQPN